MARNTTNNKKQAPGTSKKASGKTKKKIKDQNIKKPEYSTGYSNDQFYREMFNPEQTVLFLGNYGLSIVLNSVNTVEPNEPVDIDPITSNKKALIVMYESASDHWGSPCQFAFSHGLEGDSEVIAYQLNSDTEDDLIGIMQMVKQHSPDLICFDIESILWGAPLSWIKHNLDIVQQHVAIIRLNTLLPIAITSPIDQLPKSYFHCSDNILVIEEVLFEDETSAFQLYDATHNYQQS